MQTISAWYHFQNKGIRATDRKLNWQTREKINVHNEMNILARRGQMKLVTKLAKKVVGMKDVNEIMQN